MKWLSFVMPLANSTVEYNDFNEQMSRPVRKRVVVQRHHFQRTRFDLGTELLREAKDHAVATRRGISLTARISDSFASRESALFDVQAIGVVIHPARWLVLPFGKSNKRTPEFSDRPDVCELVARLRTIPDRQRRLPTSVGRDL